INLNGCDTNLISPLAYSEIPVNITLQDFIDSGGKVSNTELNYIISYVDESSSNCPLIITRTITITTSCSNFLLTQTFTIEDTIAPTISISASDLTVECDGNGNLTQLNAWLAANGGASASDSCSSVTWSNDFSSVSNECGATGSVTVTFTATDECGNTETTTATFTIEDTTAPYFISELPQNITVSCDSIPVAE